MRNSFVWWSTAAAITFGFSIAGLNTANAESVMRTCASEWKQAQAGGTTGGQAWPQFLAQCRTRQGAAAPTAAPAPGPSVRLPIPMVAAVSPGFPRGFSGDRPKRHESVCKPMERRQGRGNDRRSDLAAVSVAMPRAPNSPLRRQEVSFPPRPQPRRPPLQSGSLFPWWQQSAPSSAPASNVGAPSALQAGQYTTELAARARCPSDTVVWVNTPTRIYHYSGTRYYGHTLKGAFMCEADARTAGYRASRNRQREAQAHSG